MDDLFGFLFGAAIVIAVVMWVVILITTVLINLYPLLDRILGGWGFLPAPLAWAITSAVAMGLLHFACAESHRFRRPGLKGAVLFGAFAWMGLAGIVGLSRGQYAAAPVNWQSTNPKQHVALPTNQQSRSPKQRPPALIIKHAGVGSSKKVDKNHKPQSFSRHFSPRDAPLVYYVTYERAKIGTVCGFEWWWNGRRSMHTNYTLRYQNGNVWNESPRRLQQGSYQVRLVVNGVEQNSVSFEVK